jgi:hypothetical protein
MPFRVEPGKRSDKPLVRFRSSLNKDCTGAPFLIFCSSVKKLPFVIVLYWFSSGWGTLSMSPTSYSLGSSSATQSSSAMCKGNIAANTPAPDWEVEIDYSLPTIVYYIGIFIFIYPSQNRFSRKDEIYNECVSILDCVLSRQRGHIQCCNIILYTYVRDDLASRRNSPLCLDIIKMATLPRCVQGKQQHLDPFEAHEARQHHWRVNHRAHWARNLTKQHIYLSSRTNLTQDAPRLERTMSIVDHRIVQLKGFQRRDRSRKYVGITSTPT